MEHALKSIQLIWNLLLLLLKILQNKLKWVFNLKCRNRVNISAKKLCIDEKSSARAWTSVLIARPLRQKNKQTNKLWIHNIIDLFFLIHQQISDLGSDRFSYWWSQRDLWCKDDINNETVEEETSTEEIPEQAAE